MAEEPESSRRDLKGRRLQLKLANSHLDIQVDAKQLKYDVLVAECRAESKVSSDELAASGIRIADANTQLRCVREEVVETEHTLAEASQKLEEKRAEIVGK